MPNALDLLRTGDREAEVTSRIQGWFSNSLEVLIGQGAYHFSIGQWKAWEGASSLESGAG